MRKLLSNKEFSLRINKLCSAQLTVAKDLQDLIEDGLLQASHPNVGGDGSLAKLTQLMHSLAGTRQFPMRAVKAYIADHTSAKWQKLKDGTMGYKFPEAEKCGVTMPTVTWWDHKASNENSTKALEVHVVSRIKAVIMDSKKDGAHVDNPEFLAELEDLYLKHKGAASKKQQADPVPVNDFDVAV